MKKFEKQLSAFFRGMTQIPHWMIESRTMQTFGRSSFRVLMLWLLACFLFGCTQATFVPVRDLSQNFPLKTGSHRVEKGETLFLIAWSAGWDYKALARANKIPPPYRIRVGQKIRFDEMPPDPPASIKRHAPQSPKPLLPLHINPAINPVISWRWPIQSQAARWEKNSKGLDIHGKLGQPVISACKGRVVYAGSGLKAYGQLIIIRHNEHLMSAYAFNRDLWVQEGQAVEAGQKIAGMGAGRDGLGLLHFEIRLDGQVVDPLQYLPTASL